MHLRRQCITSDALCQAQTKRAGLNSAYIFAEFNPPYVAFCFLPLLYLDLSPFYSPQSTANHPLARLIGQLQHLDCHGLLLSTVHCLLYCRPSTISLPQCIHIRHRRSFSEGGRPSDPQYAYNLPYGLCENGYNFRNFDFSISSAFRSLKYLQ